MYMYTDKIIVHIYTYVYVNVYGYGCGCGYGCVYWKSPSHISSLLVSRPSVWEGRLMLQPCAYLRLTATPNVLQFMALIQQKSGAHGLGLVVSVRWYLGCISGGLGVLAPPRTGKRKACACSMSRREPSPARSGVGRRGPSQRLHVNCSQYSAQ